MKFRYGENVAQLLLNSLMDDIQVSRSDPVPLKVMNITLDPSLYNSKITYRGKHLHVISYGYNSKIT
jgi:hypothetical protein